MINHPTWSRVWYLTNAHRFFFCACLLHAKTCVASSISQSLTKWVKLYKRTFQAISSHAHCCVSTTHHFRHTHSIIHHFQPRTFAWHLCIIKCASNTSRRHLSRQLYISCQVLSFNYYALAWVERCFVGGYSEKYGDYATSAVSRTLRNR